MIGCLFITNHEFLPSPFFPHLTKNNPTIPSHSTFGVPLNTLAISGCNVKLNGSEYFSRTSKVKYLRNEKVLRCTDHPRLQRVLWRISGFRGGGSLRSKSDIP